LRKKFSRLQQNTDLVGLPALMNNAIKISALW
jgi:hypothetical protein